MRKNQNNYAFITGKKMAFVSDLRQKLAYKQKTPQKDKTL